MTETPGSIARRAPMVGEHTDEILEEIGVSTEHVARLRNQGAIN
jgi:crotonobetainyl-CoA:carnitine CoA-transferase CaiB-like acyl-CoA transferase